MIAAAAQAAGVYVAGQGFTLEQTLAQALREQGDGAPFWIVAAGAAARRLAGSDGAELVARVHAHGGIIYACARDLSSAQQARLPPGVELVQQAGAGAGDSRSHEEPAPVPESRRGFRLILRTCAALQ